MKKEFLATTPVMKNPPDLVHLQFSSNRLSYKDVTRLEIYMQLKALDFCKERIFK